MVNEGQAKKLTVYLDEDYKTHGKPVYEALIDLCHRKKIAGVSVFRGVAGYGSHGVVHTAKMLELSTSLPVKVEIVDCDEKIREVLPDIAALVGKGLVEISDTNVVRLGGEKRR